MIQAFKGICRGLVAGAAVSRCAPVSGQNLPISDLAGFTFSDRSENSPHDLFDFKLVIGVRSQPGSVDYFSLSALNDSIPAAVFETRQALINTDRIADAAQIVDAQELSFADKRYLLSDFGVDAILQYGDTSSDNGPNDTFRLLQSGETIGICGSVATMFAALAKSFGFEDAGTHSLVWNSSDKRALRGRASHVVAHFRDPQTGHYWLQNYDTLIDTGSTALQDALNLSTLLHSPFVAGSEVESEGTMHYFRPRPALWTERKLREYSAPGSALRVGLGNIEESLDAHYGLSTDLASHRASANIGLNTFAGLAKFHASEGTYSIGAAGLSSTIQMEALLNNSDYIRSMYTNWFLLAALTRVHGADPGQETLNLEDRANDRNLLALLIDSEIGVRTKNLDIYTGLDVAALDQELSSPLGKGDYSSNSLWEMRTGLRYAGLGYERTFHWLAESNSDNQGRSEFNTAWDRLYFGFDLRSLASSDDAAVSYGPFTTTEASIFAFEGVQRNQLFGEALGYKLDTRIGLATENWGTFSAYTQIADTIRKQSSDPYYEMSGTSWQAAVEWLKSFDSRKTDITLSLGARGPHTPIWELETISSVTPDLAPKSSTTLLANLSFTFRF